METIVNSKLVEIFLDFGEAMLTAGAEIARVEDSLTRMAKAYGFEKADVFAITSSIVLSLKLQDGTSLTSSRRIRKGADFDFEKIDRLNSLARSCANNPPKFDELSQKVRSISKNSPKKWQLMLGSFLAAGSFSLFFGGTLWDGILSALFGLLVCQMQLRLSEKCPNKSFFLFLASFLCGIGICLLGKLPFFQRDMVIIGDIMLLVPGIAITTATRDMVIGDTISGSTRLIECIVWTVSLAGGFMLAMILIGR